MLTYGLHTDMEVTHLYTQTIRIHKSAGSISQPSAAVITLCYLRVYALLFYYSKLLSSTLFPAA